MLKKLILLCLILAGLLSPSSAKAVGQSFVTVVNPIRGYDFWDLQEKPIEAVLGEKAILQKNQVKATWLIRYDALKEQEIISALTESNTGEVGLFLEITPTWTKAAGVVYRESKVWHNAGSVFLSGYTLDERKKLIDEAFKSFKETFGIYPKSVGAWWIDSYSLGYMQEKYNIIGSLIVADQYSTDNYQIWGQYFATPYYPAKNNTLMPAQTLSNKLPVVMIQWAARDPVNGYGKGVEESTYSVQANDYIDYHNLNTGYFSKLIDVLTKQPLNQFNQVTVGLENSYSWKRYQAEYEAQIKVLVEKRKAGGLNIATMSEFAGWYQENFPEVSPEQIIIADDPLGSKHKAVWFMNNYYRAGWFYNQDGSVFRDVRQYLEGQNELCIDSPCQEVNFAKFSTRVLDEVTNYKRLVIDQGRISDFQVDVINGEYRLSYLNEAGRKRLIRFLPRDIAVDDKISSVDGFILDAVNAVPSPAPELKFISEDKLGLFRESFLGITLKAIKFIIFLILGLFIPGLLLVGYLKQKDRKLNIFLSVCCGLVLFTLVSFLSGLFKINWLVYLYLAAALAVFIKKRINYGISFLPGLIKVTAVDAVSIFLIITGTVFQTLIMLRSGWVHNFGVGFWGPNGHDGIWHQALINQLVKNVPPQNPGLSGVTLSNYHYFYDLLVSSTYYLSKIPVADLIYRFYPLLFSLLLGVGTWFISQKLINHWGGRLLSLYLVYFAGSFGWIVEYIKYKKLGGESDFWVNQPVSMNINPPFAVSLLLVIAVVILLQLYQEKRTYFKALLIAILTGSLIEFKVYAGVLVLAALFASAVYQVLIKKDYWLLAVFSGALIFALGLFFPQNSKSADLLVYSPFWFIHSMVDFPDRVGWTKLSTAREVYYQKGLWLKYLLVEMIGLFLFIAGNLGTRILAAVAIIPLVKNIKQITLQANFVIWLMIVSFILPVLFVQKGNPWNTIQFFYYSLFFAAILAAGAMVWLQRRLPPFFSVSLLLLVLLLTPINSWVSFKEAYSANSPSRLTFGEMEALSFLSGLPEGVVLTYPYDKKLRDKFTAPYPLVSYETSAYVAAYSGKPSYLEDEIQQEILQTDYKKRRVESVDFFKGRDTMWMRSFLQKNNIRYIYLPKAQSVGTDFNSLEIKQVFDNNEVRVYEVN